MKVTLETPLAAPPEAARRLFRDVERWPEWMPGLREITRIDEADDALTVSIEQTVSGRRLRQTAVVTPTSSGFVQRRIAGEPARWILAWSFVPQLEDSHQTDASVTIDADFGVWGRLTPRRLIERALDDTFRALVDAAEVRLGQPDLPGPSLPDDAEVVFRGAPSTDGRLQIVESTDGGVARVVFDGRTYRATR
ncbi:MAG: SRPBCC family protein [Acidobacteriota bacterium]